MIKSYSELITIPSFKERLEYLMIRGHVGFETFGSKRYLNQILYKSAEWKRAKRKVILRDSDGNHILDLAHIDHPFATEVYVHHINPITEDDILRRDPKLFDPDNLICCSFDTHNAIHYGLEARDPKYVERKSNDTCPWR